MWKVYILECSDNTLYTGVTTDLLRRISEHNGENNSLKGAKYTRIRRPVNLVYNEEYKTRSEACSREYEIKKLSKLKKLELIGK